MKITNEQLKQIIKEELEAVLNESVAGRGETTGLSGRTGYAKSSRQKGLDRQAAARQAQTAQKQFDATKDSKKRQADKRQAAKDRAAPGRRIANINELSKFLVKDTMFKITTSLSNDFPSNDTDGFYKALNKIAGISQNDFLKIIEKEAEEYMTKKNITQLQDKDEKKITDSVAIEVKSLIRDAKKKARNRTFMQKAGSFIKGQGFKQ